MHGEGAAGICKPPPKMQKVARSRTTLPISFYILILKAQYFCTYHDKYSNFIWHKKTAPVSDEPERLDWLIQLLWCKADLQSVKKHLPYRNSHGEYPCL